MPTRAEQRRVNAAVAGFALALGGLMTLSYVVIAMSEGMLRSKVELHADFRDSGGIGRHTEVQLAGKLIGKVHDIQFITERYPCNPLTEDFGHDYQGRTDDCEPWMFCADDGGDPMRGVCAELETYSGHPEDYQGCGGPDSCEEGQVCVTQAFRQRYRNVRWWGQSGWCVNYDSESQRIRVGLEVYESTLQYIREDSRASIVLNGLLASPRVNISVGSSETLIEEGSRLQTSTSLSEEVFALKEQIDQIADEIDRGLLGLSALTDMLEDEASAADVEGVKRNVAELRRQLAAAEGLAGAILNDPDTRTEISQTLRETRAAAVAAQEQFAALEGKTKRSLRKIERTTERLGGLLEQLQDPSNTSLASVLFFNESSGFQDEFARLGDDTQEALGAGSLAFADISAALDEVTRAIDTREGTLGRLVADSKPLDHLRSGADMRRVAVVKSLVRWVIAEDVAKGRSEARPRDRDAEADADADPQEVESRSVPPPPDAPAAPVEN